MIKKCGERKLELEASGTISVEFNELDPFASVGHLRG
jgi:hypothetical protein